MLYPRTLQNRHVGLEITGEAHISCHEISAAILEMAANTFYSWLIIIHKRDTSSIEASLLMKERRQLIATSPYVPFPSSLSLTTNSGKSLMLDLALPARPSISSHLSKNQANGIINLRMRLSEMVTRNSQSTAGTNKITISPDLSRAISSRNTHLLTHSSPSPHSFQYTLRRTRVVSLSITPPGPQPLRTTEAVLNILSLEQASPHQGESS